MEEHYRRKRNAFASGTCCLMVGITCLIIRNVKINLNYSGYYYYYENYSALLISGIICIVIAGILYLYGLILQLRPPTPVPQTTCVIIPPNHGTGIVNYPHPAQQPMIPATNLGYAVGPYPNQQPGFMPGYQTNYPIGAFQPPVNPGAPPGSTDPTHGSNISAQSDFNPPYNGGFPEPPPPYTAPKHY